MSVRFVTDFQALGTINDESKTKRARAKALIQRMNVTKDAHGRKLVAVHDLGDRVAALAGMPPQSASTPSVLYGEKFVWHDTLKLSFLFPILWFSAHSGFLVIKYWKKGGDKATAATDAVTDACSPAFLRLVAEIHGPITLAVTLGSDQTRTSGPVVELAKTLASLRLLPAPP